MLSGGGDLQLIVRENKNITDDNRYQERNATGRYRDRQKRQGEDPSLREEYRLALLEKQGVPCQRVRTESQSVCSESRKWAEMVQWIKHLPHKHWDQSLHSSIHVNAGLG